MVNIPCPECKHVHLVEIYNLLTLIWGEAFKCKGCGAKIAFEVRITVKPPEGEQDAQAD